MSEEFSAGVQILLKRIDSNPDEVKEEYGKWAGLRDAVFSYKESGTRNAWLRGLTEAEIDALHEKLNTIYRSVFDGWVMKQVLAEPEEGQRVEAYQMAQGKRVIGSGWTDPRLFVNAAQTNSILGQGVGAPVLGRVTTSNTSPSLAKKIINKIKL